MTAAALLRDDPRVALLRRLDELPILRTLQRPGWHLLCDAPMAAHFLAQGLPPERLTQGLEHGAFLAGDFALPCPPGATVVIATRRSEEAVAGVLRLRGMRPVPLFAQLVPRLAAGAPLRAAAEPPRDAPARRIAIAGLPWSGAAVLARELARVAGAAALDLPARALAALAEARALSDFETGPWWRMLVRANTTAQGTLALRFGWPDMAGWLAALGPEGRGWLEERLARFHIVQVGRDPLAAAAADEAAALARVAGFDRGAAVAAILRRRDALAQDAAGLAAWVAGLGAATSLVDADRLAADPTGTARGIAAAAGLPVAAAADAPPEPAPRPPGQRFDRLLQAAAQGIAAQGIPASNRQQQGA
jgi:hypothetical protein